MTPAPRFFPLIFPFDVHTLVIFLSLFDSVHSQFLSSRVYLPDFKKVSGKTSENKARKPLQTCRINQPITCCSIQLSVIG